MRIKSMTYLNKKDTKDKLIYLKNKISKQIDEYEFLNKVQNRNNSVNSRNTDDYGASLGC